MVNVEELPQSNGWTYTPLKDKIREEIIQGNLSPGTRLKFGVLAERFETSTMPVRQALQDLHAEGLVEFHTNKGASVRRVDSDLVESIYDVRKALMGLMIERCILFVTNSDLIELEVLDRHIHESTDLELVMSTSDVFYRRIFAIARNVVAMNTLTNMWPLICALRRRYGLRNRQSVYDSHGKLLDALTRRDTKVAVAVAQAACDASKQDLIERISTGEVRQRKA